MSIRALKVRIEDVETRVQSLRREAEADPRLSVRLALASMERHSSDLYQQLRLATLERGAEVVALKLSGPRADTGRVPLDLLSRISSAFSDAIAAAAERVRRGRVVERVTAGMREAVGLELADVVPGSTQLFITGRAAPDLFGNSTLAEALLETFSLLEADGSEQLSDRVAVVGVRAARRLGDLLAIIAANGLHMEFEWVDPQDRRFYWSGTPERLSTVRRGLEGFSNVETERIAVNGRAIALSLRGRFEIETGGRVYSGTFPAEVQPQVTMIRLGDNVAALIERSVVYNNLMQSRREFFSLLNIKSTDQLRLPDELAAGPR
jgi:hypothetical protein